MNPSEGGTVAESRLSPGRDPRCSVLCGGCNEGRRAPGSRGRCFRRAAAQRCGLSETGAGSTETEYHSIRTGPRPGARLVLPAVDSLLGRRAVVCPEVNSRLRLHDRKKITDVEIAVQLRFLFR